MIKNYMKTAWRNIAKAKGLSGIHVAGLAVAIATATLLYLTAMFDLSYDRFHTDRERIGLVYTASEPEDGIQRSSTMPAPFTPAFKAAFPDVMLISRYANSGLILRHGDKQLESSNKYVDPDFLSIFSFPLVHGNANALDDINNIVIDETTARNLFGTDDIVGKPIEVNIGGQWSTKTVAAVVAPVPDNSSLTFNSLLRFEQKPDYPAQKENWSHQDHTVFVKMADPINDIRFTTQARPFMNLYYRDQNNMLKRDGAKADNNGAYVSLHILPLDDYHRNDLDLGQAGSPLFPWILLVIAGLILFIACSNFINLSLANALTRHREMGTRKTLGGTTLQLVVQLWTEALLLCVVALGIGVGMAWLILPEYNAMMNYTLRIQQLFRLADILYFAIAFGLMTLIAGGYPAWRIARTSIIQTLKGNTDIKTGGLRNSLTVLQFTVATVLIISTIVISSQLHYIANRPLGFDKSEVISIPIGTGVDPEAVLQQMRVELEAQPWVQGVSASDINIGRGRDGSISASRFGFEFQGRQIYTNFMRVDYDYLKTLGIKLVAGRDFDRVFTTDTAAVLINQQMAALLGGADNILGKTVAMDGDPRVIGIIDDFNFQDLRRQVGPLMLSINPTIFPVEYIFVRVQTDHLRETLNKVEHIWKRINPKAGIPASYLEENTQNMYKSEQRFAQIVIGGAVVAIAISCLGLFGLALLMINGRIKEIGIRKVLGSSVVNIVVLLARDFFKLTVIACLIATPLAWWMMDNWLRSFAYRVPLAWWMFLGAGVLCIAIAMSTIAWQTWRAARANPVNSLRDE